MNRYLEPEEIMTNDARIREKQLDILYRQCGSNPLPRFFEGDIQLDNSDYLEISKE